MYIDLILTGIYLMNMLRIRIIFVNLHCNSKCNVHKCERLGKINIIIKIRFNYVTYVQLKKNKFNLYNITMQLL